ncbi:transcriptional regulator FilR1 domain-containing protein, partial [Methanobrevibacter sp.]|uniref:transcriptional regulator FilR1 domain-containing protein n=1 Tax=Methanobrevibacter sp. TaxID=66852 RepID=UPI00388DB639
SPQNIKDILVKNLDDPHDNLKIDFFDFNEFNYLLLLCTDKNMVLGFFKDNGNYDQNRLLTSTNDDCIKWANELFENFKKENM